MAFALELMAFIVNCIGFALRPVYIILGWFKEKKKVPPITDPLLFISAVDLAAKIRGQEVKSEDVIRGYIERIKSVNPIINAIVEDRFQDALKDAKRADQLCATTAATEIMSRYPLLGVPFTVKESCGLEGYSQAVGSMPRKNRTASADGVVIANLKAAGAIPLLISANPEFCLNWECKNLLTGVCNNPYDSRRSSGGSSGGEAALIGSGSSVFGVGSDIAGSIRIPALFSGIFGHKATGGLLSTVGHYPNSTDPLFGYYLQTGPMVRYSRDLPILMQVMAGENAHKLEFDKPVNSKDIKIYSLDYNGSMFIGAKPNYSTKEAISKALMHFKRSGREVTKIEVPEMDVSLEISLSKFLEMDDIPDVLTHPDNPKLRDNIVLELLKHLFGSPKYSFAALVFVALKDTRGFMTTERRKQNSQILDQLKSKLENILRNDGVLLYPTMHCPAFRHNTSYTNMPGIMYTTLFNALGFPATHIPMGLTNEGLPVGFQVVAAPFQDKLCFTIANELEDTFGGWVPPTNC